MDLALAAVAFAPGLAIGSFLNVVAARVPRKRSIVSPGSACLSCGHELAWYENVPVASWLALRGKCKGCGERIGVVYPAVELVTALLIAASFLAFGWSAQSFVASFFCAALVTVSATDLSHRIIPNVVVLPAAAVVLVAMTVLEPSAEWALGAFGASLFLFLAALAYPKGMGMGDV
jgi:prepilin signal peptidase PulO-like enzyme (type II secretory pathway)